MMLNTPSFGAYKRLDLKNYIEWSHLGLHPDKSPKDAIKFKALGTHKDWVDALTEADFASSQKQLNYII